MTMDISEFLKISTQTIKDIVETKKGKNNTIVYAYDGTRRSFLIEEGIKSMGNNHGSSTMKIDYNQYSKVAFKKLLYHLVMMFQHGIQTIVYPMWFCTLEQRGPEYLPKFIQYLWGVVHLLEDESLLRLYESEGIRVIFYGEYRELLLRGNDQALLDKFELIMEKTKQNTKRVVLFGTNIDEPSNTIIKNTLLFYNKYNRQPNKNELIMQYYGVEVEDVSMYIGFDRFSTDGRPILISDKGNEDLYYTVSPHSFLSESQFRKILFDHLYQRTVTNAKEYELTLSDVELMKEFYQINSLSVMGVGAIQSGPNFWHPLPQVQIQSCSSVDTNKLTSSPGSKLYLNVHNISSASSTPPFNVNSNSDKKSDSFIEFALSSTDHNFTSPPHSPKLKRKLSTNSCSADSAPSSPTIDSTPSSISLVPISINSSDDDHSSGKSSPRSASVISPQLVSKHLSPALLKRIQPFLQPS
ncbi:hypothetical protein DLAC_01649 [Tieghemostelium lacteum]|uniref:Uncharacterized protein n=1 Tax=Tieghemostelium lacteum TaxID=361077 RepID=A0A152A5Y5_TIELA|nr:hypothetical protein DLAC_01649 [Tieghemostelium lacteum]|eukprot:KYR01646.1 hypothetical protein DLAC_01649 [Tieghemostelium lacteum]